MSYRSIPKQHSAEPEPPIGKFIGWAVSNPLPNTASYLFPHQKRVAISDNALLCTTSSSPLLAGSPQIFLAFPLLFILFLSFLLSLSFFFFERKNVILCLLSLAGWARRLYQLEELMSLVSSDLD